MTPKEIRGLTGLSQVGFCNKYHIPLKTYQKWEQGTNICPGYVLELLERVVRFDIDNAKNSRQKGISMDETIALQEKIDYYTEIENKAIELISEGKYKEAIELLKSI